MLATDKHNLCDLVTANEVSRILDCNRSAVERLQLKGQLTAVSTIYPKYYFEKSEVLKLKELLTSKKAVL